MLRLNAQNVIQMDLSEHQMLVPAAIPITSIKQPILIIKRMVFQLIVLLATLQHLGGNLQNFRLTIQNFRVPIFLLPMIVQPATTELIQRRQKFATIAMLPIIPKQIIHPIQ
jgi:hypothetical protein